ncbi:angiopoietin-related protein 7-like [Xenia sp. Carnegie-2017]|uniref:angiopoietin-related protein 7-like n=1 Tax=Xenia sp. Carnegie-2017 TaxID=2897299 RepID=UPI001F037DC5|nr:angiopoietin-related protein 7-like [Xenia sp. Carnegie-2017]
MTANKHHIRSVSLQSIAHHLTLDMAKEKIYWRSSNGNIFSYVYYSQNVTDFGTSRGPMAVFGDFIYIITSVGRSVVSVHNTTDQRTRRKYFLPVNNSYLDLAVAIHSITPDSNATSTFHFPLCGPNTYYRKINGTLNCTCMEGYFGECNSCHAKDCTEVQNNGKNESGVYQIDPDGQGSFNVYCDMTSYGGGWTVFQRRLDGSVDFYRGWNDYKEGFGNLSFEFWLGLDKIFRLTSARRNKLRVDLGDWSGNKAYAEYDYFAVKNESKKYQLSLGKYFGNAGDSLRYHKGMAFTTKDSDNDKERRGNCAALLKAAWWYNNCYFSNLNGHYYRSNQYNTQGVVWYHWKVFESLKFTEMKIKP